jgi:fluoride exporter
MTRQDLALAGYVAVGGALGSVARFVLGALVQQRAGVGFPVGPLLVNVTGSIAIGAAMRWATAGGAISPEMRIFLVTGVCGGYTTFSTFSYETTRLFEDGAQARALLYVVLSVGLSLAGTVVGFALARAALGAGHR